MGEITKKEIDRVKAEAIGKWPGIFAALGISVGDGSHCPCPICGGTDRFRFDNLEGEGTWICNQCGAGDGWSLTMKVLQCDFSEAVDAVRRVVGTAPKSAVIENSVMTKEFFRGVFFETKAAAESNLAGVYLRGRGLVTIPSALRFHPGLKEPDSGNKMPCILAIISNPGGKAISMHRTFLDESGKKAEIPKPKKVFPGLEKLTGAAIRLFDHNGTLGITEGIETAIACAELFKIPTWSAVSATMLEGWIPPKDVKQVMVFGDNDLNYTGQRAAYKLANRLVVQDGLDVDVDIPDTPGDDYLDMLNKAKEGQKL